MTCGRSRQTPASSSRSWSTSRSSPAMRSGGGKLTIDTAGHRGRATYADPTGLKPGRYARLRVRHRHRQAAPEVLARVFEPFFTTKPVKARAPGSASRPLRHHRSRAATPRSTPRLATPPSPACCLPPARKRLIRAPPRPSPAASGETILLVEDETSLRELASRILTRNGYRVRVASTALEAPGTPGTPASPSTCRSTWSCPRCSATRSRRGSTPSARACPSCTCPGTPSRSWTPRASSPADRPAGKTIHRGRPAHLCPPRHRQRHRHRDLTGDPPNPRAPGALRPSLLLSFVFAGQPRSLGFQPCPGSPLSAASGSENALPHIGGGGSGGAAPAMVLADGQLYGVPGGTRRVVLTRLKKLLTPTISTRALSCCSS